MRRLIGALSCDIEPKPVRYLLELSWALLEILHVLHQLQLQNLPRSLPGVADSIFSSLTGVAFCAIHQRHGVAHITLAVSVTVFLPGVCVFNTVITVVAHTITVCIGVLIRIIREIVIIIGNAVTVRI
jgi:hypothetical protein